MRLKSGVIGFALLSVVLMIFATVAFSTGPGEKLSVAVTEPDIEAIVKVVGGNQVSTFSLFHDCLLNKELAVDPDVMDKLIKADAIVWTGFFNESDAISRSIKALDDSKKNSLSTPEWIDVSRGVRLLNLRAVNSCNGFMEENFMFGNPFFRLNPMNAHIIAKDIALSLAELRPSKRSYFLANAKAFKALMNKDITRWKKDLAPLKGLKVFSTQCGWRYFGQMGAPDFVVCKKGAGNLPVAEVLADHINQMKVSVVMVDPHTPGNYLKVFKSKTKAVVVEVPSSIDGVKGADSYQALFDNMIKELKKASGR